MLAVEGLIAKPLSAIPLVPYGDESEGDSGQDGSRSIIEDHDFSFKLAYGQKCVPSGIGVYTRPNAPSDIILGTTSGSRSSSCSMSD